ncbi:MAG: hypothetical protein ACXU8U_05435 [Asticcacaulis sp.]
MPMPTAPSPLAPARDASPGQGAARAGVEIIHPDQFADRRSEPRTRCDASGAMLFLSTHEIINCRILDQSPSGARVSFDSIGRLPEEIWLIDLSTNMVRRGQSAWSTPNRMGLKFNFVQTLVPGQPRPIRVPQEVYDAWLRLSGNAPPPPPEDDGDVLFLD